MVWSKERLGKGSEHTPFIVGLSVASVKYFNTMQCSREDCVRNEALRNSQDGTWSSFVCMMAATEVLGVSINSHYPHTTMTLYESTLNVEIYPRSKPANKNVHLFWSRSGNIDNRSGAAYEPNHFVPVFIIQKSKKAKLSQSDSSQPKLSQPELSQAKRLFEKLPNKLRFQNNFDQGRGLSFGPNNIVIDSGINPKLELSKQAEKTSIMGDKNVVNPSNIDPTTKL